MFKKWLSYAILQCFLIISYVAILSRMKQIAKNPRSERYPEQERTPTKSSFASCSTCCAIGWLVVGQGSSGAIVALAPFSRRSCSVLSVASSLGYSAKLLGYSAKLLTPHSSPCSQSLVGVACRQALAPCLLWLRPIIWSFAYGFTPGGWLARSFSSLAPLHLPVGRCAFGTSHSQADTAQRGAFARS